MRPLMVTNQPTTKDAPTTVTPRLTSEPCAVVSLKPRHPDWVRDFDFKLNLFSLPSPCNYYLFSRRIP